MEVYAVNTGNNTLGFRLLGFSENIDVDSLFSNKQNEDSESTKASKHNKDHKSTQNYQQDWDLKLTKIPDLNYKSILVNPHSTSNIYKININELAKKLKKGYILFANDLGNIYYTQFSIEDPNAQK
jgi:hypothetical protein